MWEMIGGGIKSLASGGEEMKFPNKCVQTKSNLLNDKILSLLHTY